MSTPRKVLLKAAKVMMERGLGRGDFEDSLGRVCMLGAIRIVAQDDAVLRRASQRLLRDYLSKQYYREGEYQITSIIDISDDPELMPTKVDAACTFIEAANYKAEV